MLLSYRVRDGVFGISSKNRTLHNAHRMLYLAHCPQHTEHRTLHTKPYTPNNTQHTVHITQHHTLHSPHCSQARTRCTRGAGTTASTTRAARLTPTLTTPPGDSSSPTLAGSVSGGRQEQEQEQVQEPEQEQEQEQEQSNPSGSTLQ